MHAPHLIFKGRVMNFYYISDKYVEYLYRYDNRVRLNKGQSRPYIGILFEINGIKYYAPLASPKEKHKAMSNTIDFRKIKGGEYGAINFNNMIPVPEKEIINISFDDISDDKYKYLLLNQYKYINQDSEIIMETAIKLRNVLLCEDSQLTDYERRVKRRCCDIGKLEKVLIEYEEKHRGC